MSEQDNLNRKRIHDLRDVVNTATVSLADALADGDEKHPPGSWQDETSGNHINHLVAHLRELQAGKLRDERGHSHLAHIICRAVMARLAFWRSGHGDA